MDNVTNQKQKKDSIILSAIKVARPVHWIKNLSIFAAILLTGAFFEKTEFAKVVWGFIAFCLASSATYVFNDIVDSANDRLHPTKKFRPIASGSFPMYLAVVEVIGLVLLTFLVLSLSPLNSLFTSLIIFYLILQAFYSLKLKNIAILDILIIATGFILRVYAGAFAIDAHLSVWFLLCVISVALFLASGKRRAELNLVQNEDGLTRKSLKTYKTELLNSFVTMFGNASWMSWALFTFFESPRAILPVWLALAELSKTTTVDKLLMLTIPVTIFGIMRYEFLIFEGKSETPEKLLLTDRPLIIAVGLWMLLVYWILYSGVSVGT